jgi:hypothetical protein
VTPSEVHGSNESIEVERILGRVRAFEQAARAIVDDERLTTKAVCIALLNLQRRALREEGRVFVEAAIWRACRSFFEGDQVVPREIIEANHRLLRRGHTACPECRRELPSRADLERWRELGHEMYRRSA